MTSIPAAANCLSLVEDQIADCLASLSTFQAWTGTATDVAAKAKIYHDIILTADEEREELISRQKLEEIRPYAQIYWGSFRLSRSGSPGSTDYGHPGHSIIIDFEDNVLESYRDSPRASERAFKNSIGGIVLALFQSCNVAGYPEMISLAMTQGVGRTKPEDKQSYGDALFIRFTAQIGHGSQ